MQLPLRPGVVLYATGNGQGSALKDYRDGDINPAALTAAHWLSSAPFSIGRAVDAVATLAAKLATGKSLKIRFEVQLVDDLNPSTWQWAAVPSTRLDSVSGPEQIEHTVMPADLVGMDLGSGATVRNIAFRLTQASLCGLCRVLVTAGAPPDPADSAIVAVVG